MTAYQIRAIVDGKPDAGLYQILRDASQATGLEADVIKGARRTARVARARQYCMWQAFQDGYSIPQICEFFSRDYTTVKHGIGRIDEMVAKMEEGK